MPTSQEGGEAKVGILGSRVDILTFAQAEDRVLRLLEAGRFAQIVTFGSEMAMLAARDAAYRSVINAADLVVADTIGVAYAARLLGRGAAQRVAGVDLADSLCGSCARHGLRIFLLGGAPGVATQAAKKLKQRYVGLDIGGTQHGFFSEAEDASVVAAIARCRPRLLLVALGFPKQEFWIHRHAPDLETVICMGVGGTLDVFAGHVPRAPKAVRRMGLEWLYRLLREPQRLARQRALPQFALSVLSQAWFERRREPKARPPQ